MNRYAPAPYAEAIVRLALGVELRDPVRGGRALSGVRVTLDEHPAPLDAWRSWAPWEQLDDVLPKMQRHGSGRFAQLLGPSIRTPQHLRVTGPGRRYVPRRFAVTIATEDDVVTAEDDPAIPDIGPPARIFRPSVFPGAAYEVTGTHVRGRITRAGQPVRWARVQAVLAGTSAVAGWAHADDRGEYILPIGNIADQVGFAADPLPVELIAGFRQPVPVASASDPLLVLVDPLWDLVEEAVSLPVADDPGGTVADGRLFPAGYATHVFGPVALARGRPHVVDLDLP